MRGSELRRRLEEDDDTHTLKLSAEKMAELRAKAHEIRQETIDANQQYDLEQEGEGQKSAEPPPPPPLKKSHTGHIDMDELRRA